MSNKQEFSGKTVDAALAEAERALGVSRDAFEHEVITAGSRGVFGLGGEQARISVRHPLVETEPAPAAAQAEAPSSTFSDPPTRVQEDRSTEAERPARRREPSNSAPTHEYRETEERTPILDAELAQNARTVLETLLTKMGFEDVSVEVRSEGDPLTLDIAGDDLGVLIGRRGDSLAALQFMLNVILSKEHRQWPRVVIDVQGYRTRREQSLHSLGQRVAERVQRNRRPFTLEAMPANDRRIIHIALRDRPDIETYSVGEGQSRRVVIAPKTH